MQQRMLASEPRAITYLTRQFHKRPPDEAGPGLAGTDAAGTGEDR